MMLGLFAVPRCPVPPDPVSGRATGAKGYREMAIYWDKVANVADKEGDGDHSMRSRVKADYCRQKACELEVYAEMGIKR